MPDLNDARNNSIIHIRIRDLRRQRSLTQEELADALGISRQSVNAMEAGRCLPSLPVAMQIAQYFSVPLSNVFLVESESGTSAVVPWSPVSSVAMLINRPAANVFQTPQAVCVEVRLSGYELDEIDLEVGEDFLTVSSKGGQQRAKVYDHEEFAPVAFERTIQLPVPILGEKAEAEMRQGILTVLLPRFTQQQVKVSRIRITSAD